MTVKSENGQVSIELKDISLDLEAKDAKRLAELIVTELTYKPEVINYLINSSNFKDEIVKNEDIIYVIADECRAYKDCNEDVSIGECIDAIIVELGELLDPYKVRI